MRSIITISNNVSCKETKSKLTDANWVNKLRKQKTIRFTTDILQVNSS